MGGPPFSGFALVPHADRRGGAGAARGAGDDLPPRRMAGGLAGRGAARGTAPISGCCCGSRRRSSSSSGSRSWTRPTSSGSSSPSTPRSAPRSSRRLRPTAWPPTRPATRRRPTPIRSRCGRCRRSICRSSAAARRSRTRRGWHKALLGQGVRLGQPVKCVRLGTGWGATLRVGLTMWQVADRAALSDEALALSFAEDMARVREALIAVAG